MKNLRYLFLFVVLGAPFLQACKNEHTILVAADESGNSGGGGGSSGGNSNNPTPTIPGNEGGNGGVTLQEDKNTAWFLSEDKDAELRVCILQSDDFGMPKALVAEQVRLTFLTWLDYTRSRSIKLEADNKTYYLALNPKIVDCQEEHDLKLYLGSTAPEVEAAKKQYFMPVGFAQKTSYDNNTGWGKGFIWMAAKGTIGSGTFPDWHWDSFRGVLLHELGHVIGCEHVGGTVMREDILKYIKKTTVSWSPVSTQMIRTTSVDQERVLAISEEIHSDPKYWLSFKSTIFIDHGEEVRKEVINKYTLEEKQGTIGVNVVHYPIDDEKSGFRITYFFDGMISNFIFKNPDVEQFRQQVQLPGTVQLDVEVDRKPLMTHSDTKAFKMKVGNYRTSYEAGTSMLFSGSINVKGVVYPVLIQENGAKPDRPLSIWMLKDNRKILIN